jgi:hypothetical protein
MWRYLIFAISIVFAGGSCAATEGNGIDGWWGYNPDACFDEAGRVAVGHWEREGTNIVFGHGYFQVGMYDDRCVVKIVRELNGTIDGIANCEGEGNVSSDKMRIELENNFTLRIISKYFAKGQLILVRCGDITLGRQPEGADPTVLSCDCKGFAALVVFKKLRKLRIWYGDGGGDEWINIDFTREPITTDIGPVDPDTKTGLSDNKNSDKRIVLSANYQEVIFDSYGDHYYGKCHPVPASTVPLWWITPALKQPWEYNRDEH